jgi:DNA-binding transcriptional MerR regulator/regulator of sirC expression with transglutaminase-like and TPR domain
MPNAQTKKEYTLSEIAQILGVDEGQLHRLAHKGLIDPKLSNNDTARFNEIDYARLKIIKEADELGYKPEAIFRLIGKSNEVLATENPAASCEDFAMAMYKRIYDELNHCEPLEQLNKQCDLRLLKGYIKNLKELRTGVAPKRRKPKTDSQSKPSSTAKGVKASIGKPNQGPESAPTPSIRPYSVAKYWEYMKKVEELQREVEADIPHDDQKSQDTPLNTIDDDETLLSAPEDSASGKRVAPSLGNVSERAEPRPGSKVFDKQQSWGVWILAGVFLTLISAGYFFLSSHNDKTSNIDLSEGTTDSQQGDLPTYEPRKSAGTGVQTGQDAKSTVSAEQPSIPPAPSVNLQVQRLSLRHDQAHNTYEADFTIAKSDATDNRESVSGYAFVYLKFGDETTGAQSLLLPSGETETSKPAQVRRGARFTIKNFMQMRVAGVSDLPPGDMTASRVLVYSPEGELLLEKAFKVSIQPFFASSEETSTASAEPGLVETHQKRIEPVEPAPPPAIVPDAPPTHIKEKAAAPPSVATPGDSGLHEQTIAAKQPVSRTAPPSPPKVAESHAKPTAQTAERRPSPPRPVRSSIKIRSTGNPEAAKWEQKSYNAAVQGDFDQAIVNASKAIELDPGRVNPYVNRSWAYLEKDMLQAAIQDCDTALSIDPQNAFAYNNRGLAYQRESRDPKAEKDYRRACDLGLDLGCQNLDSLTKQSRITKFIDQSKKAFNTKDWDSVIRLTTEAIDLDSENAVAYTNRSAAYAQKNYLNKALKDSNEAIKLDPDFPLAYNNRGYVLELLGNNRKAAADYLKSCSLGLDLGCKNFKRLNQAQ